MQVACVLVGLPVCCRGRGLFDWVVFVMLLGRLRVLGCLCPCFLRVVGMFGIALGQGNGSRGMIRAHGERALVSSCSIILLTYVGLLMILLVLGSRMDERFVGAVCCWCFLSFEEVFKMDLRASLGFHTNIWRSAAPYLL